MNLTYTATALSGPTVPLAGVIVHCPIFREFSGYPFPPFLLSFLASFLTSLVYFLEPFLSAAPPPGAGKVLAASNLASRSF